MPDPVAPDVPVQPQPISTAVPDAGSPATPTLAPQPSMAAKVLGAISDALGGKTSTTGYTTDASGKTVPTVHQNTRGDQIRNIIGSALRGASAGAQVKGPNAGIQGFGQGFQAQQQFGQQQDILKRENANKDFEQQQKTLLNQATIANYNNQTLLERRRIEDTEGEEQNKLLEAQNNMSLALAKADAQPLPVIVNGEDINGKPGNEAEMMKYFSDPNNHKVPEGYALAYTYSKGPDGKLAETVHQVPIENAKQTLVDMPPSMAASLGIKPDQAPKLSVLDLAGLQAKIAESSKNKAETFKANAEGNKANAEASALGGDQLNHAAQMLVEGDQDPSQLSKRGSTYQATLNAADTYSKQKYGKPFDIAQAQADYKFANEPQTQNTLKLITGMTEPGGAIDIAKGAATALPQANSQLLNKLFNASATQFGSTQETNFHTAMLGLADEYSKVMGGGVSSDTGRQQALDILKSSYSKGQLNGAVDIMRRDIAARHAALVGNNRYLQKQYGQPQPQGGGQQGQPVTVNGQIVGYTTDGKTMTPVGK